MAETAKRPASKPAAKSPGAATAVPQGVNSGNGAGGSSIQEQILNTSPGSRIRVEIASRRSVLEGTLFTACSSTSLLAMSLGPTNTASGPASYRVLPFAAVSAFAVLSPAVPNSAPRSAPPSVNRAALQSRANIAVQRAKERVAKINKTVDRKTQDLFDALDKQFTARWKGKDVIVMERVAVRAPGYRSEDCKVITKDGEGLLGRVRKVLENEKRRALQREAGGRPTGSPVPSPNAAIGNSNSNSSSSGAGNGPSSFRPAVPNIVPAVPVPQGMRKGG